MNKLRAAVIGCGAISETHIASILNTKDAVVEAVCDIKEDIAKYTAKKYNCKYYTDYKKLIDELHPDVVHICLPHYLHAPVSIYALEHGCNVLCEKPMAISAKDAEMMLKTATKTGKVLEIIFQNRYNNASRFIKETIVSGRLGKVMGAKACVCWQRSDEYYSNSDWRGKILTEGGGVCVNQAIHTLDLMLWFVAKKPIRVNANINTFAHDIEVEDEADGIIIFDDNTRANFWFTNNYCKNAPVEIEVVCENGIAVMNGDSAEIFLSDGETLTSTKKDDEYIIYENNKSYWGVSHVRQVREFYAYISEQKPMLVNSFDAFETHKVMCAILKSGRDNHEITI